VPLEAKIIAVADAFEAMTGTRPYRSAVSVEQAIAELHANAGTQFDPDCVSALVEVVNDAAGEEIFSVLSTEEAAPAAPVAKGGGGRSRRAALASAPAVPVR
jgi:HD-GYP domain-containing protein (c-di-GMP phosphodiesterase class II)